MEATPSDVRAFFKGQGKVVLTFLGYSGAGYEDEAALLGTLPVLDQYSPSTTIVNIGVTPDGIGRVYELARQRGFPTSGIVSTQAQREPRVGIAMRRPCLLRPGRVVGRIHRRHRPAVADVGGDGGGQRSSRGHRRWRGRAR